MTDQQDAIQQVAERARAAVGADRCSIYRLDQERKEMVTVVAQGLDEPIRLPLTRGVIGFVGRTGRSLRLRDVYNDPRFDPSVDQSTGYRTRSILCVPVTAPAGGVVGAVEMINKLSGHFTQEDEDQIKAVGEELAPLL